MNNSSNFPIMQTHLDFHTSPDIVGIGTEFSKENFQSALKAGNLDSITVFAKCHHGMCYYPTKIGTMHPHLNFDLTGAMIEAAHEIGVRAPVYITAGWSHHDAQEHPEWCSVDRDEYKTSVKKRFEPDDLTLSKPFCHWKTLCLNDGNGYTEHIYQLTEEICNRYKNLDGLFYDICAVNSVCYCESCLNGMKKMGLDPEKDEDAKKYFIIKRQEFFRKCSEILKKYHPDSTIFFNGCVSQYLPQYHDYLSHFEMEDLPTAWGGYDKLPMRAKYFSQKEKPVIGMTGKFHLTWGEFGGFKSKDALKFEIATMALYGAGASVGDHMHPDGKMEMQTYENIGYAYKYLEKIAPYCFGGEHVYDIGVYVTDVENANEGISKMLIENQMDYGIISDNNFDKFDTVIIPGRATLSDDGLVALEKFLENGGKLVLMQDALIKDGAFQIDFGVKYVGKPEYDCDYLISSEKDEKIPGAPMLCKIPGNRVEAGDSQVFAESINPYFSRTYERFCGHMNTPQNRNSKHYAAILKNKSVVYISHPLAEEYLIYGSPFHKYYFMSALKLVHGDGIFKINGMGSQGRCTMLHQPDKNRYCLNLAYASPVKRGMAEIIEDILPLYNIDVSLKINENATKVYLPLTGEILSFEVRDGRICFTVPELNCHTTVVIEY